jgi:hypothetical protein
MPKLKSLQMVSGLLRAAQTPRREDSELDEQVEEEAPTSAAVREIERARRQSFEDPSLPIQRAEVDNRVFLLGFDALYRRNMKRHERRELLACARAVAKALQVSESDQIVESYYADDRELAEYFLLLRALQKEPASRRAKVASLCEFECLEEVVSSPLFGIVQSKDALLPTGVDPLYGALWTTPEWTVPHLLERAYGNASRTDDYSITALAALSRDPVTMASVRESVALYSRPLVTGTPRFPRRELSWTVDEEIAARATRFVATFNSLFGDDLPVPCAENADVFWDACDEDRVVGRCVALAEMPGNGFYHWAVRREQGKLVVDDFWSGEAWTTDTYCAERSPW